MNTFEVCDSLTSIIIPNSITKIGDEAFYFCESLTTITIPNSVTESGKRAFSYCRNVTSVYCKSTTPPIGYAKMFYSPDSRLKIYVPRASVSAYKTADGWSKYADAIEPYDFTD